MKQKTRFKNFGNIGIGLKNHISRSLVVLLYFPFKNTVVSQGQCAESVASSVESG